MRTEREATRIVESWLEDGSTALPDRVLDAVLSDLPSTQQRRSVRSPWRSPYMSSFLKLGAVAAVVVLAVVVGVRLLPGGTLIGAPGPSETPGPTASPTLPPGGFGGTVTIPFDSSTATIEVLGSADGATITGTALFGHRFGNLSVRLTCLLRDGDRWTFGGVVESVTTDEPPVGSSVAVIVVDGPQQRAIVWNPDTATTEPCDPFVAGIPDTAFTQDAVPVQEGRITLPTTP